MLIEGFGLEGVTQLAVDSIFMMPHLGVLASVNAEAAREIFENDCLIHIGVSVVPQYNERRVRNAALAEVFLDGCRLGVIMPREVAHFETRAIGKGLLKVVPLHGSVNVGGGVGEVVSREVVLGEGGIICDGRNRPLCMPEDTARAQQGVFHRLGLMR